MASRVIRTREQRIADTERELAKLKQGSIDSAVRLRTQAEGWVTRSAELLVKAEGASTKADEELKSIGLDPVEFWAEHSKKAE